MKLKHKWHMYVSHGSIENDGDLTNQTIIGAEHGLLDMAARKLHLGIWDCVWIFPPGSDSSLNAIHPDNPYVVGELGMDDRYISWIHLDE